MLKNVIALAAGMCDGMDLGVNAKASLVTRGMIEMARLGQALGTSITLDTNAARHGWFVDPSPATNDEFFAQLGSNDSASSHIDRLTAVLQRLRDTGHDILSIDYDQLDAFAGNMLELRNRDGDRVVALSRRAYDALSEAQRERLEQNGKIVVASIDTIEASAGGSVRCMLAEVHFPESA